MGRRPVFLWVMAVFVILAGVWAMRHAETTPETGKEGYRPVPRQTQTPPVAGGYLSLYGKTYSCSHEIENYLIIGTDDSGNEEAEGDRYRGGMADFLLLVIVDKTEGSYSLLALNRDTITEVVLMQRDGSGMATADIQLCTAHWYGGNPGQSCENTVRAVSGLLGGIPIKGYYAFSLDGVRACNHAVGGVTVKNESDFSDIAPSIKKGKTITLTDNQAVIFVQSRIGVDDGENTSRMSRQIQYMEAFLHKAQTLGEEKAKVFLKLYRDMSSYAVTDISGKKFSRLIWRLSDSGYEGMYAFDGKTKLGKRLGDGLYHTEFIPAKKSVKKVLMEIYHLE